MKNSAVLQITTGLLILAGLSTAAAYGIEPAAKTELLWPNGAPGAKGNDANDKPTISIYLPAKEKAAGSAVVIFPGGGYQMVAIDHEGRQVARWLNELGIAAFVVDYRHRGRGYGHPAPIQDAQRAIRTVRSRSAEFGIEPNKIGVIGFSAGGHLASTAGTHFNEKFYDPVDANDGASARPDFMILIYPVISMGPLSHSGSRSALLGRNVSQELADKFSNEKQVDSNTPPTFLVHATDDKTVPAENSISFYLACKKAHVPAEIHIWQKGEHGFGLGKTGTPVSRWPALCADWMNNMGLCGK
ncbi:MAG: alpha/beta hydrolase [Sedimentisphaerales bacterium]|jgi:acetyl esterase/lipase